MSENYDFMVHSGAGNVTDIEPFEDPLLEALTEGRKILESGGAATTAVSRAVQAMESHPRPNAGVGSALTEAGTIEMEAAIMSGDDLSVGAVALINFMKNPVALAELVRLDSRIVKLVGNGALDFAMAHDVRTIDEQELITERQKRRLEDMRVGLSDKIGEGKMGTVGAVARDTKGLFAAATSTGGLMGKLRGRVGDTSTIGAGTYADSRVAVSGTGNGESFVRSTVAKNIASLIELTGMNLYQALTVVINQLESIGGKGGVIAVDSSGFASRKSYDTTGLIHGAVIDGESVISLEPSELNLK